MSEKTKAKARATPAAENAPATVQKAQKVGAHMQETIEVPLNLGSNLAAARKNPKMAVAQTGAPRLTVSQTLRFFLTWATNFADVTLKDVDDETKRGLMLVCQPPGPPYGCDPDRSRGSPLVPGRGICA